ncbi:dynamin family protein [Lysinibacillus sp. BW-2-10]|uniref:dynamin family protein n=1 Tax=Lysinibacillus sp. BW-2-10 TaxID=2590030 RepID=UPI00117D71ED|nr:dynamin family protein [Lysinibacillus sp. BW-2-10]TSI05123.1 hypothetical protein FJQ64_12460 [Lysinibacillus sp. BW-2-10]
MAKTKKELQSILFDQMSKYGDDLFFGEELQSIHNRLNNLYSSIVVVGQFSVGKSALLNALLGESLLSARRIESTKVLTRIRYCPTDQAPRLVLQYQNGQSKEVPVEDIADLETYTTFQGTDITDELRFVDVFWPLSILDEQLILIDTPGANSLTSTAFQVTEHALVEASAVMYLFNGQKGIDQTDYDLLSSLIQKQKRIFFVATHVDDLTNDDWLLVQQNVQQKLQEHVQDIHDTKIYPVSSIKALQGKQQKDTALLVESNIGELEADLFAYMEKREYEEATLKSISYDLDLLLHEISNVEAEQQAHNLEVENERQQRLERLIAITKSQYQEVLIQGEKLIKERYRRIESQLNCFDEPLKKLKNEMKTRIQEEFKAFRQQVHQQMSAFLLDVSPIEQAFMNYEKQASKSYSLWEEKVQEMSLDYQSNIIQTMSDEDDAFVDMLESMNTNVDINWNDFKQKLIPLKIKPVDLYLDQGSLGSYKEALDGVQRKYAEVKRSNKQLKQQENELSSYFEKELQNTSLNEQSELHQLGDMPEVEHYIETQRKLLFFKKTVAHYDDSRQRQWKEEVEFIKEKYMRIREGNEEMKVSALQEIRQNIEKLSKAYDQIGEEEDEIRDQLMRSIAETINNNSTQVLQTYRHFEEDVDSEWNLHKQHHLERCEQHLNEVSQVFQDFVLLAEKDHVSKLYVN